VDAILAGRHPIEMTAQELITLQEVPAAWASQVPLLIGSPDF
jgi:hypothetical protein